MPQLCHRTSRSHAPHNVGRLWGLPPSPQTAPGCREPELTEGALGVGAAPMGRRGFLTPASSGAAEN